MEFKSSTAKYLVARNGSKIPVLDSVLDHKDYWGIIKMRLNIGRNRYTLEPGIYAVGRPDETSPVLVTANYKMSFDLLRKELGDLDVWILVLNTYGINVWCAAGKGTFGTAELIGKIAETDLKDIVSHRKLIVPQLGAVGVAAHEVTEHTDFRVIYGPVRARDLANFIQSGCKASQEMRTVTFGILDRAVLVPAEVVTGFKYVLPLSFLFVLLSGFSRSGFFFDQIIGSGATAGLCVLGAFAVGAVLSPLLLPYIPGRAFSAKGFILNSLIFILFTFILSVFNNFTILEKIAWFLMTAAIASFFAMNFTGATTFTSLSGVKKEMRYAAPAQITGISVGFVIWIIDKLV